MNVLVTGAYGRCGTAIIDHLHDLERYDFTYLNRTDRPEAHPYGGYRTAVADISDYDAIYPAFDGRDAIVHLAAFPQVAGTWEDVLAPNLIGMNNTLKAAREQGVETFVFASTNHVVGMYEREYAPELYSLKHELVVDHESPVRPDSFYGATKSFGEALGRYYVENFEYPKQFYTLRICSVRWPENDHPYGDAERGVQEGDWERGSDEYQEKVARLKAMWHSRRDFAHQVNCCLQDETVSFDIFYGVSDNQRRWFDLEHSRTILGYAPQDNGEKWDAPPS